MAALSDRELDAISDSISLRVLKVLGEHEEKMHESSRIARESVVEAVTGYAWKDRHKVRGTIQWATEQKDTHNKRRTILYTIITGLGIGSMWESIANFFSGKG